METLLLEFCRGFAAMGHQVQCVVANEKAKRELAEIDGVKVKRVAQYGKLMSTSISPEYLLACRSYESDIWHHHFPNPLADLAALLGNKATPMIMTYHSDIIRQAQVMKVYAPIMNKVLDRTEKIIVATPNHFKYSKWLQPFEHKVEVIPFGIELDALKWQETDKEPVDRMREEATQHPIFLNVGRLVGYKGQSVLIKALKNVSGTLWIVGQGPLEQELKLLTHSLGLENRVRFWGEVSADQLRQLNHACDIFAFPSITPNEAFGLVQAEAMACGKPVICTDLRSGVPCVNLHGKTGLVVKPGCVESFAEAMKTLGDDGILRNELGMNARERAFQEFEKNVMLRRYINLMESVAGIRTAN